MAKSTISACLAEGKNHRIAMGQVAESSGYRARPPPRSRHGACVVATAALWPGGHAGGHAKPGQFGGEFVGILKI